MAKPTRPRRPRSSRGSRPLPPAGAPGAGVRAAPPRPVAPPPIPPTEEFLGAAAAYGIAFDEGDVEGLGRYLAMLLEANTRFNLTAITDPAGAWMRHIFDALTLVPLLGSGGEGGGSGEVEGGIGHEASGNREEEDAVGGAVPLSGDSVARGQMPDAPSALHVIDVGSGGGVPGIPLAIVMPGVKFTLLEPTGKKALFLEAVAAALGLGNVTVLSDRAERVGQLHKVHREKYDAAVCRAVGHLAIVAELCVPLVKRGGLALVIKGGKADEEVKEAGKAIGLLGSRHAETIVTPTGRIVVLEKASRTPRDYPRLDGEPKRSPLGIAGPAREGRREGAREGGRDGAREGRGQGRGPGRARQDPKKG